MIFWAALLAIATGWGLFMFVIAVLSGTQLMAVAGLVTLHLGALAVLLWGGK